MKQQRNRWVIDQAAGAVINEVNVRRETIKEQTIKSIEKALWEANREQDANYVSALGEIQRARDFLGDPSKILGNSQTKHGEIAEQMDVHLGNARELIRGLPKRFSLDGVGRTAPEDYIMDGIKAQSKFINSESKTLTAVLDHMKQYRDINFGRDGSVYVIPKDYYANVMKIWNGEDVLGFSARQVRAIREKIAAIEAESGMSFPELIKGSKFTYREVQKLAAQATVDSEAARDRTRKSKINTAGRQNASRNRRNKWSGLACKKPQK